MCDFHDKFLSRATLRRFEVLDRSARVSLSSKGSGNEKNEKEDHFFSFWK